MKKILILFSVLCVFLFVSACNEESNLEKDYNLLDVETILNYEVADLTPGVTELTLVTKATNGSSVEWTSSDEIVINTSGSGMAFHKLEDKVVTLTAKLSNGTDSKEKKFVVTVKSVSNVNTIEQAYEAQDDNEVVMFGQVKGILQDGFYIGDGSKSIFIQSELNNIVIGGDVYVSGVKKMSNSKIFIEDSGKSSFHLGTSEELLAPTKQIFNTIASSNPLDLKNYGRLFSTDAVLQSSDNDNEYIITNYPSYMKISKSTSQAVLEKIEENLGKKVAVFGILHENVDDIWEVALYEVTFEDLSVNDKILEISKWLITNFPSDGSLDGMRQVYLPTTHPVYGGEIVWGLSETQGIISENGTISPPFADNYNIKLMYTIVLDGISETTTENGMIRPIILSMSSMILDVHEVMTRENYDIAKANWNLKGNYTFDGLYHVKGEVVSHQTIRVPGGVRRYSIVIKDLQTADIISFSGLSRAIEHDSYGVGDIVTYSDISLRAVGNKLMFVQSSVQGVITGYVHSVEKQENFVLDINYEEISAQDFVDLDMENFDTYNKFYHIKDTYLCRADNEGKLSTTKITSQKDCTSGSFASEGFITVNAKDARLDILDGEGNATYRENGDYKVDDLSHVFVNQKGYVDVKSYDVGSYMAGIKTFVSSEYAEKSSKNIEAGIELLEDMYVNLYSSNLFVSYVIYDMTFGKTGYYRFSNDFIGLYSKATFTLECYEATECVEGDGGPRVYQESFGENEIIRVINDLEIGGNNTKFKLILEFQLYDENGELVGDSWILDLGMKEFVAGPPGTGNM